MARRVVRVLCKVVSLVKLSNEANTSS
jgi:hypothetical protein